MTTLIPPFTTTTTPVWIADPDMPGCAKPISGAALERAVADGHAIFGSIVGCVLYAGVQASAFDHPLAVEPTWSGARIIANGWTTKGLEPDGQRARYRIAAQPGQPQHVPPLHPSDLIATT